MKTIDHSNHAVTSGASQFPERFFATIAARKDTPRFRLYAPTLVELKVKMAKANVRMAPIYDAILRMRVK